MKTGPALSILIRFFRFRSVWLFIFCTICLQAFSQPETEKYIINRYTTENGLPQNSIKGLAFDHLGYCWLGTENGLVKYDGIRFRLYDTYDTPPVSSRVAYVKQNNQKEILVAFEGGQFYKIQDFNGFGTRPVSVNGDYSVSDYPGFQEMSDESTRSFFKPIKKKRMEFTSDVCFILNDHQFYRIKPDSLWIANKNRTVKCIVDKRIGKYPITVINDQLVMILNGHQAIHYTNPDGNARPLTTKGSFFDQLNKPGSPYSTMCSASGTYTFCKGILYKLTLLGNTIYSTLLVDGLSDIAPTGIHYEKASGTYYLQSDIDGLLIVRPNRFQHVRVPIGSWWQNSFYGQNNYGIDQIIANGTLFSFGKKNRAPVVQTLISSPFSSINAYVQKDTYYYEKNFYLHKFNLLTKKDSIVTYLDDYIHCFSRSAYDSTLYFSTSNKIYSLKRDKITYLLKLPEKKNRYIYGFTFLNADSLLIATSLGLWGAGLHTGKAEIIIPAINVRNIYADKQGYTWLGTYNYGVYLMKSGTIKQLPIDINKRLSVINSIVEDKQGRIWFSTNNGLLSTRRNSIINFFHGSGDIDPYTLYTKSDGLITNEFNGGAYPDKVYLSDGRMSIPSIKGLVVFKPEEFPNDLSPKKVFIENVRVDGKLVTDLTNVTLAPDYNSLTISVSAPWKNKAETLNFEQKVEGHDREWISFQYGEDIHIRDYGYGNYKMYIRIKGLPQSQIEFNYSIAPYYYETIWFKLAIALVFLLAIFLVFNYTINYYKRKNVSLDQKIKERTLELNESLKNLNLTVEQLQLVETRLQASLIQKDRIIDMLLHDMKSPLFALKNGIEELDYKLFQQTGLPLDIVRKSNLLREGINDVYSFSVNFFEWVKYQKEGFTANYQLTRLSDAFGKLYELYGSIAKSKGITLVIEPTEVVFYTDENILITILRNLVDNAIKNTQAGIIRIYVETKKNEYLIITVEDAGPGMAEHLLEKIQDAFNEDLIISDHTGYGYKLILHLVHLIHGDLELENKNGLLVRVILNFEFGQES